MTNVDSSAGDGARTGASPRSMPSPNAGDLDGLHEIVVHGHRVFYRSAGTGPVLVLVHGITSTSETWSNVLPYVAERFTVLAPHLLGHGESAKPSGDYSLGAYASGVRDLLVALGHERATFVGHSLGGGIAMQLAYQFPEHCERLVLVRSGGLGREITALLRAASLPGSELVLPLLANERVLGAGRAVGRALGRVGLRVHTDLGRCCAATRRCRTARRAPRSCIRCGRSSMSAGSGSTRAIVSTWRGRSRS
jgi:pimeloyl-ACP methyl ester carboxylesterase